jgi:large subunit ribosomal protein L23Ae
MSGKGKAPAGKAAVAKAAKTAKAARVGTSTKKTRVHTKTHFYLPKTLKLDREPKYKRSLPNARGSKFDKYRVIRSPLTTET